MGHPRGLYPLPVLYLFESFIPSWFCFSLATRDPGLLCRFFFRVACAQRCLGLGDRKQRGIELDERGVDGAVILMAAVAGGFLGSHLRGLRVIEAEKRPLTGEAGFVLDMDLKAHHVPALKVAALVD